MSKESRRSENICSTVFHGVNALRGSLYQANEKRTIDQRSVTERGAVGE